MRFRDARRGLLNLYRREVLRDHPLREAKRWFGDRGDETLRLDYPLTSESFVVDLGGYVGQWAYQIYQRYGCRIHVFEPHPRFYEECKQRFSSIPNVTVHNYGLSDADGRFSISDDGDASSFLSAGRKDQFIQCELRNAQQALCEIGLKHIDLLKINIEGGEYQVLPNLISSGWINRVRFLQTQFHTVGDFEKNRENIRRELSLSHIEQWCYDFVWEGWERKVEN